VCVERRANRSVVESPVQLPAAGAVTPSTKGGCEYLLYHHRARVEQKKGHINILRTFDLCASSRQLLQLLQRPCSPTTTVTKRMRIRTSTSMLVLSTPTTHTLSPPRTGSYQSARRIFPPAIITNRASPPATALATTAAPTSECMTTTSLRSSRSCPTTSSPRPR
jgi:hypothetical protein